MHKARDKKITVLDLAALDYRELVENILKKKKLGVAG